MAADLVLGAWLVQAGVGAVLLRRWLGHRPSGGDGRSRPGAAPVVAHLALSLGALGLWVAFVATGRVALGWTAFAALTVGNGVGDSLLVRRSRRTTGVRTSWTADYRAAIGSVFAGRLPRAVTFHALFSGVVYFGALAACLTA